MDPGESKGGRKGFEDVHLRPFPYPRSPNVIPVQSFEAPYALQANLGTSYIKLRQGKMSSLISRNGAVTEVLLPDLYLTPLSRPQLRSVVFKG